MRVSVTVNVLTTYGVLHYHTAGQSIATCHNMHSQQLTAATADKQPTWGYWHDTAGSGFQSRTTLIYCCEDVCSSSIPLPLQCANVSPRREATNRRQNTQKQVTYIHTYPFARECQNWATLSSMLIEKLWLAAVPLRTPNECMYFLPLESTVYWNHWPLPLIHKYPLCTSPTTMLDNSNTMRGLI